MSASLGLAERVTEAGSPRVVERFNLVKIVDTLVDDKSMSGSSCKSDADKQRFHLSEENSSRCRCNLENLRSNGGHLGVLRRRRGDEET
jgi:hypothetical protein